MFSLCCFCWVWNQGNSLQPSSLHVSCSCECLCKCWLIYIEDYFYAMRLRLFVCQVEFRPLLVNGNVRRETGMYMNVQQDPIVKKHAASNLSISLLVFLWLAWTPNRMESYHTHMSNGRNLLYSRNGTAGTWTLTIGAAWRADSSLRRFFLPPNTVVKAFHYQESGRNTTGCIRDMVIYLFMTGKFLYTWYVSPYFEDDPMTIVSGSLANGYFLFTTLN